MTRQDTVREIAERLGWLEEIPWPTAKFPDFKRLMIKCPGRYIDWDDVDDVESLSWILLSFECELAKEERGGWLYAPSEGVCLYRSWDCTFTTPVKHDPTDPDSVIDAKLPGILEVLG